MKGLIPRGLRVQIFPTFEAPDTNFRDKWEAVLSDCSFKFMDLLIEEEEKKLTTINKQIEELHSKIEAVKNDESLIVKYDSIMKGMHKLETSLLETKKTKLARDVKDYSTNMVYRWSHIKANVNPMRGTSWFNKKRAERNPNFINVSQSRRSNPQTRSDSHLGGRSSMD
ncbi:hypothetical protein XELAEV_18014752mg [Xenopus laevis]|uniref:Uncharacterized protein n=1 Tax=Xenopus laevis TaxID=8355 RepID=A0A974DJC9_XENLA|nr:hypothetical protein XELAEV_18014752mg [Xenopus laevis]